MKHKTRDEIIADLKQLVDISDPIQLDLISDYVLDNFCPNVAEEGMAICEIPVGSLVVPPVAVESIKRLIGIIDKPETNEFIKTAMSAGVVAIMQNIMDGIDNSKFSEGGAETVSVEQQMREAIQEFVDRCERGEIRSRYTYTKFKTILDGLSGKPLLNTKDGMILVYAPVGALIIPPDKTKALEVICKYAVAIGSDKSFSGTGDLRDAIIKLEIDKLLSK